MYPLSETPVTVNVNELMKSKAAVIDGGFVLDSGN